MAKSPSGTRPETADEMKDRLHWEKVNQDKADQHFWSVFIAIGFGLVALIIAVVAFSR